MNCPSCKSPDSSVTETRIQRSAEQAEAEGYGYRRRRQCNACKHRWTTIEINAELFVTLVNVIEGVQNLIEIVSAIPDRISYDMKDLFEMTRRLRAHLGQHERRFPIAAPERAAHCPACGGACRFPTVGIDPVTCEHYFGG